MKQKYPCSVYVLFASLLINSGIINAQTANPHIRSVQYSAPVDGKGLGLPNDAVEDASKRTLFSSTWFTKSGKMIARYSKQQMNYPDSNGNLQPVDLTLHSSPTGGWVADKQPNACYLHSDRSTTISLGGNNQLTFNKNCTVNGMALDQHISSMEKSKVTIDMSEGVKKELYFLSGGIKSNYIFNNPLEGGASVAEEVDIPAGCKLQKDEATGINQPGGWSGDYQLVSADGKLLAVFMAPECYDANKHSCYANYRVAEADGKTILTTTIPNEWLATATYPVTLDPKVYGVTSHWGGGGTFSCLYPNFHSDSILVTIPPKITITYFTIDYAYVTNTTGRGIPLSDGIFYLSTPCARTDTLGCIDDTAGICYLVPYEDFHNPMTCCYGPSCSPQSFWLDVHLSRYHGGAGCDSTTVWYSAGRYSGFEYFFSAQIEGYTDSVTSLTYLPGSQCSNSCSITMNASMGFGVPPYKVTHPWAAKDTITGAYASCVSTGMAKMKLTIPGVNCPFVCLSPDTTIMVPPPTVVDACGDTVKNLKAQPITLKPIPVLSISPDTNKVCSGLPVTLNVTSCVPGTTFSWTGSDNASGTGSAISDNTADTGKGPMIVKYVIVGSANGCNSQPDTAVGIINPYPIVNITGSDTLGQGHSEVISATGGGSYFWSPSVGLSCTSCPNPTASPTVTTTYTVDVIDSEGCERVKSFTIMVLDNEIVIPNVITPNNDGINDYFLIKGLSYYPNSQLSIYDRWGKEVYTSSNYQNNWNGGGQSDGVYFYVLALPTGKKYKGDIQIIK